MKCRIKGERSLRCLGLIWLISSESSSRKKVELKFLTDIVCRLCSSRTTEKKWKEGGKRVGKKGRKEEGTEGGKEKRRIGHISWASLLLTPVSAWGDNRDSHLIITSAPLCCLWFQFFYSIGMFLYVHAWAFSVLLVTLFLSPSKCGCE